MTRKIIETDNAPQAIGPYSQAVQAGDTCYVSGQIALDPATQTLVDGDIGTQARRVFDNLAAVAEAAGMQLDHAVKLQIYLPDLGSFGTVNDIMSEYFSEPYPARAAVGVAALPKGAQVEADAILVND